MRSGARDFCTAVPPGAVIAFLVFLAGGACAGVDYCSVHTFRSNSSWLQFTKEMSSREYFVPGAFKSLHCCAKGYRSIEWYKDGRPYPWPGSFILYPESANQTVYSPAAQAADAGNYSCLVRNDTAETWHHTTLMIVGDASSIPPESLQYSGRALPTYAPRDQVVRLGDDARFFCEAFIGRVSLPDARSAIWWRREDGSSDAAAAAESSSSSGGAVVLSGRHRGVLQKETSREDEQILGVFLEIRGVRREDLGQYTCAIHSLDNQRLLLRAWLRQAESLPRDDEKKRAIAAERELRNLVLPIFGLLAGVVLLVLTARYGQALKVAARDALARPPREDGCEWDVLVCHGPSDAPAANLLVQSLTRLGLRPCTLVITSVSPQLWASETSQLGARSRRLVALLSPELVGLWVGATVEAAAAALRQAHQHTVLVTMVPLPFVENRNERAATSGVLEWGTGEAEWRTFWTALRLCLPPRQRRLAAKHIDAASTGSPATTKQPLAALHAPTGLAGRRPRAGSHESLEVLV